MGSVVQIFAALPSLCECVCVNVLITSIVKRFEYQKQSNIYCKCRPFSRHFLLQWHFTDKISSYSKIIISKLINNENNHYFTFTFLPTKYLFDYLRGMITWLTNFSLVLLCCSFSRRTKCQKRYKQKEEETKVSHCRINGESCQTNKRLHVLRQLLAAESHKSSDITQNLQVKKN